MQVPADVLSAVYDAATDGGRWPAFCAALNAATGAPVKLFGHSTADSGSLGLIGAGWDPEGLDLYHRHYAALNPWMRMDLTLPVGAVGVSDQAMPRDELVRTEFYNDWLRHQEDVIAGPAVICYRTPERFVALVAACRRREVDEALPRLTGLLGALSPHLTRAIGVAAALGEADDVAARGLDASPHAVLLVTRSGRMSYANVAASVLLREDAQLKVAANDRLTAHDEGLATHVSACVTAMQAERYEDLPGPRALQTGAFGVLVVHAHPIPARTDRPFPEAVWSDPVVGAFVITGVFGLDDTVSGREVAAALGASPAEAELAGALVSGRTLNGYATERGLSRHTVRNQVRALFAKTGASSQADLVLRLQRLASPFMSPRGSARGR